MHSPRPIRGRITARDLQLSSGFATNAGKETGRMTIAVAGIGPLQLGCRSDISLVSNLNTTRGRQQVAKGMQQHSICPPIVVFMVSSGLMRLKKEYTQICGQALPRASSRRLVACTSHVDEWHFLALWWLLVSGRQTPYSYIFSYHALATNSLPILLPPCLTNPLRLNNRNNAFLLLPSIRGYARLEDR
jgi:hypothetical protein